MGHPWPSMGPKSIVRLSDDQKRKTVRFGRNCALISAIVCRPFTVPTTNLQGT